MSTVGESSFESDLKRLERTVKALESGELGLDAALAQYESSIALLAACHARLDAAGQKVALLTGVDEQTGEPETAPFDASATFDDAPRKAATRKVQPPRDDSLDGLPF